MTGLDVQMRIFWYPSDPSRVCVGTDDPRFFGPGGGPGLRAAFSSNWRSADYNPRMFNRVVAALAAAGQPAPPPCPVGPRRLVHRLGHAILARHGAPV